MSRCSAACCCISLLVLVWRGEGREAQAITADIVTVGPSATASRKGLAAGEDAVVTSVRAGCMQGPWCWPARGLHGPTLAASGLDSKSSRVRDASISLLGQRAIAVAAPLHVLGGSTALECCGHTCKEAASSLRGDSDKALGESGELMLLKRHGVFGVSVFRHWRKFGLEPGPLLAPAPVPPADYLLRRPVSTSLHPPLSPSRPYDPHDNLGPSSPSHCPCADRDTLTSPATVPLRVVHLSSPRRSMVE
jgi:hypothetical protein